MNYNVILPISIAILVVIGYFGRKYLPDPKPKAIGIDLGTSYSSVGAFYSGKGEVKIFTDESYKNLIPSVVTYTNDGIFVGHWASELSSQHSKSSFNEFKRVIGRTNMTHADVEQNLSKENIHYELIDGQVHFVAHLSRPRDIKTAFNSDNSVGLNNFDSEKFSIRPEDLSTELLKYLKEIARKSIGATVTNVVIGVPVDFDSNQRQTTILAAQQAGLTVLRLMNEPTAAAMAYGLHTRSDIHYILVFDLGGGTLDVSVLKVDGNMFITQSIAGNNHLGGRDFTRSLFEFVLKELKSKGVDCQLNETFLLNVYKSSETTKRLLSTQLSFEIIIENPCDAKSSNDTFKIIIDRFHFEKINSENFLNLLKPINVVLKNSQFTPYQIDEIVLVGGSTRMPKLRSDLTTFFGKRPSTHVDPDLAVVTGLSIQAGILSSGWPLPVSALDIVNSNIKKEEL